MKTKRMEYKKGKKLQNMGYKAIITGDDGEVLGDFNSFVVVGETEDSQEVIGATDLFGLFLAIERLKITFANALESAPVEVQSDLAARMLAYLMAEDHDEAEQPDIMPTGTTGQTH